MNKFCPNCGKEVPEGSQFCENCGAQVNGTAAGQQAATNYMHYFNYCYLWNLWNLLVYCND